MTHWKVTIFYKELKNEIPQKATDGVIDVTGVT